MTRKNRIPSVFTLTMVDCFAGIVAAFLVLTFFIQIVQSRQRSLLLVQRNAFILLQAEGFTAPDANGEVQTVEIPIVAELLVPPANSSTPTGTLETVPSNFDRFPLYGGGAATPRDFCIGVNTPHEITARIMLAFRNVNAESYPRFLVRVRPYSPPATEIIKLRFSGTVVDARDGSRTLAKVVESTMSASWLNRTQIQNVDDGLEITLDRPAALANAQIILRLDSISTTPR